jgi:hypothetical protein
MRSPGIVLVCVDPLSLGTALFKQEILMNYFILAALVAGVLVLMAGILLTKEPGQTLRSVFFESSAWGVAFFIAFGAESMLFADV